MPPLIVPPMLNTSARAETAEAKRAAANKSRTIVFALRRRR